jgi:hypothetical protein
MKLSVQMEKLLAEKAAENCELKLLQIEVFSLNFFVASSCPCSEICLNHSLSSYQLSYFGYILRWWGIVACIGGSISK